MRIIFVYFYTVYTFIQLVACLEDTPVNNIELEIPELNNNKYGSDNSDIILNTVQLIKKYGYDSEEHVITTEDGYLLTLHRIVGEPNSHPVLLLHGLLGSSADWVILGPQKALAYLLANRGYDVWLGNFRGNTYSRAHTTFSTKGAQFWDFSWHEMGIYDLPAMISFITNLKQSNLTYIGHCMGVTAFYVMSSLRPDISSQVKTMYALSPAVYLSNMKSPVRYLAHFSGKLQFFARLFGKHELFPQNGCLMLLAKFGCNLYSTGSAICRNLLFLLTGFDEAQMDTKLLPVILSHTPAGASTKSLMHYLQEVKSAEFRQFDYGWWENLKVYNSMTPPKYDISKVSVPVSLYYAKNDWLVDTEDVLKLSRKLSNIEEMYEIPFEKFNNVDFLWAKDAPTLVYNRILSSMETVETLS